MHRFTTTDLGYTVWGWSCQDLLLSGIWEKKIKYERDSHLSQKSNRESWKREKRLITYQETLKFMVKFLSKSTETEGRGWHVQSAERRSSTEKIDSVKLFKNEGRIKTFLGTQKLTKFNTGRHSLQEKARNSTSGGDQRTLDVTQIRIKMVMSTGKCNCRGNCKIKNKCHLCV